MTTPVEDKSKQERLTEDILASTLLQIQTGNVLMAAGQNIGEDAAKADPSNLDKATLQMNATILELERASKTSLAARAVPGRYRFDGEPPASSYQMTASKNLSSAIESFSSRADATLTSIVVESEAALMSTIDAISNLHLEDIEKIISAGIPNKLNLPKAKWLIGKGIAMIDKAFSTLTKLMGSESLRKVEDKVKEAWKEITAGKYANKFLERLLGVDASRDMVVLKASSGQLEKKALDKATEELAQLETKYKENMTLMKGILSAVILAGSILAWAALALPNIELSIVVLYIIICSIILLLGIDYADSGKILQRVRGVGVIANSL